jgi:pimeloyl-ACP methyl ester carboxylesterase
MLWSLWTDPDLAPVVDAAASRLPPSSPIILQHAADDRSVRSDSLEEWGRLLPDAERRLLPHGGHQFLLKRHFDAIIPWLRGLPPP